MRHVRALSLALALLASAGCGIAQVDAPISFRSDRRLDIQTPEPESTVDVPVRIEWDVDDFDTSVAGNHFAVYVDRVPLGPNDVLRRRVCSEGERKPVALGEVRRPCRDDAETIVETSDTWVVLDCIQPRRGADRQRHRHTVSVVLLDGSGNRVGHAVSTVTFRLDEEEGDRYACRRGVTE
jgi:hypothetical protein